MKITVAEPLIGYRTTAGTRLRHIVSVRKKTEHSVRTSVLCGGMEGGIYTGLPEGHDFAPFRLAIEAAELVRASKSYEPCIRCLERAPSAKVPTAGAQR